ncbi:MAG: nucleotidyltransferase family protein [Burkholderiales bacterium]
MTDRHHIAVDRAAESQAALSVRPGPLKPSQALHLHRAAIRRVVEQHRANNPRVFGSVAHGLDTEESDLDILVDPTPETTLFDIGAIRLELRALLGVPVDVLTPNGLPDKFRELVLAEAISV